jgi:GlpG protein
MRLLDYLPTEAEARACRDWLELAGIPCSYEADGAQWALWVADDDDMERARTSVREFRAAPTGALGGVALQARAAAKRAQEAAEQARYKKRVVDGRLLWFRAPRGRVTTAIVVACIAVALLTRLEGGGPVVRALLMSEFPFLRDGTGRWFLPEVRAGEVWRLLSPILLHFHILHILFNLVTFWDLGHVLEHRQGGARMIGLVIITGLLSNFGQYLFAGPNFGGLSGVVYGLLGYVWMLGRHRPDLGLELRPETVFMMLAWLVICMTGTVGNVANWAHGVGLVAGMACGRWAAARD